MKLPFGKKHIPLAATALVLVLLFATASFLYDGFCSMRVIANLFYDNAELGVIAIGMTFVILSGGIDLSVGSVAAFTTIFVATMIQVNHLHPGIAWLLALALGTALGCGMGMLIHFFKLPPFLTTLGGMFFARGMAFYVYDLSRGIEHPLYTAIQDFDIPLFGVATLSAEAQVFIVMFIIALYLAHLTRTGRTVYAIGDNEQSAVLMGLPVGRTKILVYTFSGFCSALGGIIATFYMGSGNPAYGIGRELDAIACVVIGGTLLSGGIGYIFGTLLGVLIFGTIQTALLFDGRLNSWWLRIAVGLLLLLFILLQRFLSSRARKA